jgi:hypothetical protein
MNLSAKTTTPTITWPIYWMTLENPQKSTNAQTKLTLTSDLQRQQILSENIDRVLRETAKENQPPNNRTNRHQIFSYFQKNLWETTKITIEKTKFELDPNLLAN